MAAFPRALGRHVYNEKTVVIRRARVGLMNSWLSNIDLDGSSMQVVLDVSRDGQQSLENTLRQSKICKSLAARRRRRDCPASSMSTLVTYITLHVIIQT